MSARIATVLRAARAKLESGPKCTGVLARDRNGKPVDSTDPEARSWDLFGAINGSAKNYEETMIAIVHFRRATGIEHPGAWYDSPKTTRRDVAEAFDKAIKAAEEP